VDQDVQDHRAAGVDVDVVRVPARVLGAFRIIAIDPERLDVLGAGGGREVAALLDAGVLRQGELDHQTLSFSAEALSREGERSIGRS